MKAKTILSITGTTLGIIGFCLVGFYSSWWLAGGVFLMLFGNNIEQTNRKKTNA